MGTISLLVWPFDRSGRLQHGCSRWWCRMIAWTIGARIRVHGTANVRPEQSYVYMANHASLIDTPALFAYLPHQFKIMAKKQLFYVPFMGWHLWTSGHFPIDQSDGRKTARSLRRVIEGVRAGKSLAVFPEGTRTSRRPTAGVQGGRLQNRHARRRADRAGHDSRDLPVVAEDDAGAAAGDGSTSSSASRSRRPTTTKSNCRRSSSARGPRFRAVSRGDDVSIVPQAERQHPSAWTTQESAGSWTSRRIRVIPVHLLPRKAAPTFASMAASRKPTSE